MIPTCRRLVLLTTLTLAAGWLFGCASGTSSPAAPAPSAPTAGQSADAPLSRPWVTAVTEAGVFANGPMMAVDITVDPVTMQAEILPVRFAQLPPPAGQKYVVDLTDLLTGDLGCGDCLKIAGLSKTPSGNILVGLNVKHPIAAPNLSSGVGTASLHINNVRGFVVSHIWGPDGIPATADDPEVYTPDGFNAPLPGGFGDDLHDVITGLVVNADGYSRDVTPLVGPGFDTIYPYVMFGADDGSIGTGSFGTDGWVGSELQNPTGYNVFAQGSSINGDLELSLGTSALGTSQVTFRFILTASYVVSRTYWNGEQGSKLEPKYFMPEGALLSPWRVTVENQGIDGLGTPPNEGSNDLVTLEVGVRDWQKALGTGAIVPALTETTPPTGLLGASRPKYLGVDIPGIMATAYKTDITAAPEPGTEAAPILTTVPIVNNPAAAAGTYIGFVKIEDERTNNAVIGGDPPEVHELYETGGINKDLEPYNLTSTPRPYATYQLFTYEVFDIGAHAVIDSTDASLTGRLVVDARGSYADLPATGIISCAWVFNYTGNPAEFSTPDALTAETYYAGAHPYAATGDHTVGLQVTSNLGDTDITSATVTVRPARDPFAIPDPIVSIRTGITNLRFGTNAQDWADTLHQNPVGGDNFLALGNHLYAIFYGNVGFGNDGLNLIRSLDGGTSWGAPIEILSKSNPNFTQYGGASIAGAVNSTTGNDHIYIALGTISYATSGTGRIYVFESTNAALTTPSFTQTLVESYALSTSRDAAVSPAITANPNVDGEVHLTYGTFTAGASVGITRVFRIRSSTTGATGLAADTPEIIDAATGADSAWLTDTGTCYTLEIAQHPLTEDVYLLIGTNRWSYVLRSQDHGATWVRPLASYQYGGTLYMRDGDLFLDPWNANGYYVVRNRRGAAFFDPVVDVLRGVGNSMTPAASGEPEGARKLSELGAASYDPLGAHAAGALHNTGELEVFWTEAAGPSGAGTFMQNPHIQHDMLTFGATTWSYAPDRQLNGTVNGLNPSIEFEPGGLMHVLWGSAAAGTIYYRHG